MEQIPFPEKKYNIIYADPPWKYGSKSKVNNGGTEGGIQKLETKYPPMATEDILSLPVANITAKDAACFLWVTDSHLSEGIETLKSWGFNYKTIAFNWIKETSKGNVACNVAPWTLKSWEICLLGTKGAMTQYKKTNNLKGLICAERNRHSKKPEIFRDSIFELFGDLPRIELFARQKTEGWDVWGNEV